MGLNLALLALEGEAERDLLKALRGLLPASRAEPLGAVVLAGLDSRPALGRAGDWTIMVDPLLAVPDQEAVVSAATRRRLGYAFLWAGASGSAGFGVHREGVARRTALFAGGEWALDRGEPLAQERGLDFERDPEEALCRLCERLTGVRMDAPETWELPVRALRPARGLGRLLAR
jgi:hypothetical protein